MPTIDYEPARRPPQKRANRRWLAKIVLAVFVIAVIWCIANGGL
jgi:hypothetical protein